MARARDPNRDKAFEIYKEHDGNITNRAIAEMLGVPEKTIGSWKSKAKDNWDAKLNGVLQSDKRSTPKKKTNRVGAPKGNKNAVGNSGNASPVNKFPERNSIAEKHGIFSRYIPKETLEIMGMLDMQSPADIIWSQIQIQYAAIIRSQSIMFVESKDETIKEIKKERYGYSDVLEADETGDTTELANEQVLEEVEYEVSFAWDRQAQLLNAQSRAISELRTSIKQFMNLAADDDERRLKLEQMQLNIDKTKLDIAAAQNDDNDKVMKVVIVDDIPKGDAT